MTTTPTEMSTGAAAVLALSEQFAKVFEDRGAAEAALALDVFFDLNMPVWRMQLQGRDAFTAQLNQIYEGDVRIDVLRTEPTAAGFVTEHEEHQNVNGRDLTARRLWLCQVRDGAVVEAVGYCSGEWDEELRSRHAAEAPMIRP